MVTPATQSGPVLVQDPPIARFLFQSSAASWLWLVVRLFVGHQFLASGWGKLTGGKWLDGSGTSILTYWQNAVNIPENGKPLITYDWYRDFLQFMIDTNSAPWSSESRRRTDALAGTAHGYPLADHTLLPLGQEDVGVVNEGGGASILIARGKYVPGGAVSPVNTTTCSSGVAPPFMNHEDREQATQCAEDQQS